MHTSPIRISEQSKEILQNVANQTHTSLSAALDKIVEEYRRWCLLNQANEAFARLRGDKMAWKEEQAERVSWDITLSDGLKEDK